MSFGKGQSLIIVDSPPSRLDSGFYRALQLCRNVPTLLGQTLLQAPVRTVIRPRPPEYCCRRDISLCMLERLIRSIQLPRVTPCIQVFRPWMFVLLTCLWTSVSLLLDITMRRRTGWWCPPRSIDFFDLGLGGGGVAFPFRLVVPFVLGVGFGRRACYLVHRSRVWR